MGLFALLTRFVPHFSRRKDRPRFAAAPLAPRRLERRRVFDGAATGVMLEAIPDVQPYVQTSESLVVTDQAAEQAQPAAMLVALPQATIRLRSAELFEDQSVLAVIEIVDSPPMAHQITIDWGDGSPLQVFNVGPSVKEALAVHKFLDDDPSVTSSDTYTVTATVTNSLGGSDTSSTTILVKNVAPKIDSLSINLPTINENDAVTLAGTYSDPGTLDTHELDIDWDGDGNFDQTVAVSGGTFSVTRQILDDDPTGTSSDTVNVNVQLRDDDGGVDMESTIFTVSNLNPEFLSVTVTAPINENDVATLTGTYKDTGALDTHELDIDWDGDGIFDETVVVSGGSFSVSRQFLDDPAGANDNITINVRLRDDDGGVATAATTVTVENVDPVVMLNPLLAINENGTAVLSGTYTDTGTLDTHELDIDWDGDTMFDQTIVVTGGAFTVTRQFLDDNPTGTPSDTHNVNVRLRDDDGGVGTDSKQLTVNNANPQVVLVPPVSIEENEFATLQGTITDVGTLDTFTLTIDWGDTFSPNNTQSFDLGTTSLTETVDGINWDPVTRTFSLDHQYLDDNPSMDPVNTYVIAATVVDDDAGVGTANTSIMVRNVNLTLNLADDQTVNEGAELDLNGGQLGSFTDTGTQDTHTATVDWGDGSGIQSVLVTETNGSGFLSAKHIYADNGDYTVRVTVIDDDSGQVSGTLKVNVQNVDPTLTGVNTTLVVDEGVEITLAGLGVDLADPGFDNLNNPLQAGGTQETFVAMSVDWGDGSLPTALNIDTRANGGENMPTTGTFVHADHAYADDGLYTVSVMIRDDDGGFVTRTFTIMVENVRPELKLTARFLEINEGETLDLFDLGSFADPGFNNPSNPNGASVESFHYSIDWGDGTLTENNQAPASVIDGQQGVTTKGTLADSHTYVDNDDDNVYTITVTLFDDDGGASESKYIQVRVLNVNPSFVDVDPLSPNVIVATDVNNKGQTVLTIKFTDPGTEAAFLPNGLDPFQVLIDWGDQLGEPNLDARFVVEDQLNGIPVGTLTYVHQYSGPPDPLHPADDIMIRVKIRDDDFYTVTPLGAIGQSVVADVNISNPGIGAEPFRIDTTPQVPQLDFPLRVEAEMLVDNANTNLALQQNVELRATSGDTQAAADRFIELRVIDAEGIEGPGYRLRPDVLQDLPGLFRKLPDNHYAVYVVNLETNTRRLVIEVYVRNGKLIDPGDDSEGTRDRPPTDEQTIQPPAGQGAEAAGVEAGQSAAILPVFDFPGKEQQPGSQRGFSRWSAVALGLAASATSQSWVQRVDQALAQATTQQWRKLQGHNPPKPKNQ